METAVRLLAMRDHFSRELWRKLRKKGFSGQAADQAVDECQRLNYVDDLRCADLFIRERLRRGYGIRRIRHDLKTKGVDEAEIMDAISELQGAGKEMEAARQVFEKNRRRYLRESDPRKRREKIYRFLHSRGFTPQIISELLRTE